MQTWILKELIGQEGNYVAVRLISVLKVVSYFYKPILCFDYQSINIDQYHIVLKVDKFDFNTIQIQ